MNETLLNGFFQAVYCNSPSGLNGCVISKLVTYHSESIDSFAAIVKGKPIGTLCAGYRVRYIKDNWSE